MSLTLRWAHAPVWRLCGAPGSILRDSARLCMTLAPLNEQRAQSSGRRAEKGRIRA